jgi:hypothetical protein
MERISIIRRKCVVDKARVTNGVAILFVLRLVLDGMRCKRSLLG